MTDIIDDDDEVLEYDDLGDLSDLDDDMIKRFDDDPDEDLDMDLADLNDDDFELLTDLWATLRQCFLDAEYREDGRPRFLSNMTLECDAIAYECLQQLIPKYPVVDDGRYYGADVLLQTLFSLTYGEWSEAAKLLRQMKLVSKSELFENLATGIRQLIQRAEIDEVRRPVGSEDFERECVAGFGQFLPGHTDSAHQFRCLHAEGCAGDHARHLQRLSRLHDGPERIGTRYDQQFDGLAFFLCHANDFAKELFSVTGEDFVSGRRRSNRHDDNVVAPQIRFPQN